MADNGVLTNETVREMRVREVLRLLHGRSIVLIGMMGSGKTSVGRRLANYLGLPFSDADQEIEAAAGMTIPEMFAKRGEAEFREGERRVVARLLTDGQKVLATGGGAFINASTREKIAASGVSVWLKADFDVLMRRVRKRSNRPLLQTADPEATLKRLIAERYPVYAQADFTAFSHDTPQEAMVEEIISTLLRPGPPKPEPPLEEGDVMRVPVSLGARSYDILIGPGLMAQAGARIAKIAPGAACAIITDTHVAASHLPALQAGLDAAGIRHASTILPPGEATKSYTEFARVCDAIIGAKMERGDIVLALGGGVIGDLAGFAAASVRRGMKLVQIPTSLLAQVDSSVGGKTGINSVHGKNLVGAFHQPVLVLADTDALKTLPEREFRAGYAEVVKYGLINDAGFFHWLELNWREVFAGGPARAKAVATACTSKAGFVARDETEQGERALLNLGHTFGHALERLTMYDGTRLVHGEGVAIGMACAFRFSTRLGLCDGQDTGRVEGHLRNVGLPIRIGEIKGFDATPDMIVEAMFQDKKVQRGALTFILAHGIGRSHIAKNIPAAEVRAFLAHDMGAL